MTVITTVMRLVTQTKFPLSPTSPHQTNSEFYSMSYKQKQKTSTWVIGAISTFVLSGLVAAFLFLTHNI
jgi:hypothetical protein